jgi:hypothetical protein
MRIKTRESEENGKRMGRRRRTKAKKSLTGMVVS